MITIDEKLCKGCNICTEFCPNKVYEESKTLNKKGVHVPTPKNVEKCNKCQVCALMCPDQAIKVDEKDES
jgi:2-oxoglutarate ferredoxin oxidoreductase subunit delta